MGNFSLPPDAVLVENLAKGYIGTHIEQGVPVLDRDVNLLRDLLHTIMRNIFAEFIGDGVAAGTTEAFQILGEDLVNDFRIGGPGMFLANGQAVRITAPMLYSEQQGVAALTTPAGGRQDTVYLDVWTSEVTGEDDTDLLNSGDVGMQTSVRILLNSRVRVAEGSAPPAPEPDHSHHVLAQLNRSAAPEISNDMIIDMRQTGLTLTAIKQRLTVLENLVIAPAFAAPGNQVNPPGQAAGQPVQLNGTNFNIGTPQVRFGTIPAVVDSFTATQIVAITPAALPLGTPVRITVITDGGTVTSDDEFQRF